MEKNKLTTLSNIIYIISVTAMVITAFLTGHEIIALILAFFYFSAKVNWNIQLN